MIVLKFEYAIKWIDDGGYVVTVFDVKKGNDYDYNPNSFRLNNKIKYDEEKSILYINLSGKKESYVVEPENGWKEGKTNKQNKTR